MASIVEDLEAAIRSQDWKKVATALKKLDGAVVEVPKNKPSSKMNESALTQALEFYAEKSNWERGGDDLHFVPSAVAQDRGGLARTALAGKPLTTNKEPTPALQSEDGEEEEEDSEDHQELPQKTTNRVSYDPNQFRVKHGEHTEERLTEDGRVICKRKPFLPPDGPNRFQPDQEELETEEIKSTKWLNEHVRVSTRRPPQETTVEAVCKKCERHFVADIADVSRNIKGDGVSAVCMECMKAVCKRNARD